MQAVQNGAVTSIWEDVKPGWEGWYFLTSDNHFDSIQCNRDLLRRDFDLAKERNANIFVIGDWFDAMQGRFDPRRSMDELRPEYRKINYYDVVTDDAAQWLMPYAPYLRMIGMGNHESAVLKNTNMNLLDHVVKDLNLASNTAIVRGGYGGWIRLMFNMSGGDNTGPRTSIKIKFFHGSGGEAPVTRGAIQTNRQAVYLPDADIVINGHSHNGYYIPITRERISNKGALYFDTQHHLRIPGYKQAYGDGSAGWEVERGGVPKPMGSWWLRLSCEYSNNGGGIRITPIPQFDNPLPISLVEGESYDGKEYAQDSEYP